MSQTLPIEVHYSDENYVRTDEATATRAVITMHSADDELLEVLRFDLPEQRKLLNDTVAMLTAAYERGRRDQQSEIRSSILTALGMPSRTEVTANVNQN